METASKKILNRAEESGMITKKNFIKFKGTGKHIVKFISDKIIHGTNFKTGKPEDKVSYVFEENGKEKLYETAIFKQDPETGEKSLSHFIQSMAEFEYGDLLEMEWKPIPGTPRGFIDIKKAETSKKTTDDEIPVIEEPLIEFSKEEDNEIKSEDIFE